MTKPSNMEEILGIKCYVKKHGRWKTYGSIRRASREEGIALSQLNTHLKDPDNLCFVREDDSAKKRKIKKNEQKHTWRYNGWCNG